MIWAYQLINTFCVGTLSAIYHDVLKDRLYTLAPQDPLRRSSQTALNMIFHVLVKVLAPILVFTADEAFGELRACQARLQGLELAPGDSVHLQDWPHLDPRLWDAKVVAQVSQIFKLRSLVHEQLEQARQLKKIGQSLDACVIFAGQGEDFELFWSCQQRLAEFLIVSQVKFHHNEETENGPELTVSVEPASGVRCPRSWRWVPNLVETSAWGPVSERCQAALGQKYS